MDLQPFVDVLWTTFKANAIQIILGVMTVGGVMLTAGLNRKSTSEANRLGRDRFDHEKKEKEKDALTAERKKEKEAEANESKELFERQEKLYENTHRLIATMERRLEQQAKDAHEERIVFKEEITGLRKTVARLERRVLQLVTAFRKMGHEPPLEETNEEMDRAIEREDSKNRRNDT